MASKVVRLYISQRLYQKGGPMSRTLCDSSALPFDIRDSGSVALLILFPAATRAQIVAPDLVRGYGASSCGGYWGTSLSLAVRAIAWTLPARSGCFCTLIATIAFRLTSGSCDILNRGA